MKQIVIRALRKVDLRIGHLVNWLRLHRLKILGASLGRNVRCFGRFVVMNPRNLTIGDGSTVNEGVIINCFDKVVIGSDVHLSPGCQIHSGKLAVNRLPRVHLTAPVVIQDGAWIASGVVLSPGVTVGQGAVIAANSVVIGDCVQNAFYSGIPARKIRDIEYVHQESL